MSLPRQLVSYGLVGGLQLLLDWTCFVFLTAMGLAVVPANLAGRLVGAGLGFWLNGRTTFALAGEPMLSRRHALRFMVVWLVTTAVSTVAMQAIDAREGLQAAWILKPGVEALLAAVGFVSARQWVYRP